MRSGNLFSKRDTEVLNAPEPGYASARGQSDAQFGTRPGGGNRGASVTEMPLRRNANAGDYSDGFDPDDEFAGRGRRSGVRVSFHGGLVPKTLWGRIAACGVLLILAAAGVAGGLTVRSFLLRDEHFIVPSSASIQIAGNSHLTRAQLLSVFGEDVERNVFNVPLADRRAELESLPWVAHATVMRLLPNRVRVTIVERTPVAFVRQGTQIGLVDANGVLLDMAGPDEEATDRDGADRAVRKDPHYSFPVLTGISASDPLSTRAARVKIYLGFLSALDATGEAISHRLSEVDLSNPEDVKAILPGSAPDQASGTAPDKAPGHEGTTDGETDHSSDRGSNRDEDILVHFGDEKFLERYHQYQANLPEWRVQYPRLASVDMRYERQVVLEMQPGSVATSGKAPATPVALSTSGDSNAAAHAKAVARKAVVAAAHAASARTKTLAAAKIKAGSTAAASASPAAAGAAGATTSGTAPHLTASFAVAPASAASAPRQTPTAAKPASKGVGAGASASNPHTTGPGTAAGSTSPPANGSEGVQR